MSSEPKWPSKLTEAIGTALAGGWSFAVQHGKDTGDSPFVTFEAREPDEKTLRITWHTRATGTYRLFSCTQGDNRQAHDVTLSKALEALQAAS